MNISSSISQVVYETMLPGKILLKRGYIWPDYNAGKVAKISSIKEQEKSEPNVNYIKRTPFDPVRKNPAAKTPIDAEYTPQGGLIAIAADYTPGSIFEAVA